ncbi:thioredoxin family protein [Anaeromusa sp.]|uniref:thioredoxin family protein n=1 Tax=Anaeromusa sp. TaxID=1872520 RepID=UPI00262213C5|nr:thioredoxin family protein [Anaeromusa sp.]MDD3158269.1 thioredoxin family protein [Anaeromusa sp.]
MLGGACHQGLLLFFFIKRIANKLEIKVEIIDEEKTPEIAKQYDYYYVPTYFVGKRKAFEGGTTKEIVRKVFEEASEIEA